MGGRREMGDRGGKKDGEGGKGKGKVERQRNANRYVYILEFHPCAVVCVFLGGDSHWYQFNLYTTYPISKNRVVS